MNPGRIWTLIAAVTLTVLAIVGPVAHWDRMISVPLCLLSTAAWILYALTTGTDKILTEMRALRAAVTAYGDERHSSGVLDGMRQAADLPTPATLRGLR